MNFLLNLVARLLSGVLRLALLVFVSIVVLGFLCIGLAAALIAVVWALLTGRRPAAWTTFMRFREASQQFSGRAWRSRGRAPGAAADGGATEDHRGTPRGNADIVDVEFKEVPKDPTKQLPP